MDCGRRVSAASDWLSPVGRHDVISPGGRDVTSYGAPRAQLSTLQTARLSTHRFGHLLLLLLHENFISHLHSVDGSCRRVLSDVRVG